MPTVQEVFARQRAAERELPSELEAAVESGDDAAAERFLASLPLAEGQRLRARIDAERARRAVEREREAHLKRASAAQAAIAERGRAGQDLIAHWSMVFRSLEDAMRGAEADRQRAVDVGDVEAALDATARLAAARELLPVARRVAVERTGRSSW